MCIELGITGDNGVARGTALQPGMGTVHLLRIDDEGMYKLTKKDVSAVNTQAYIPPSKIVHLGRINGDWHIISTEH